MKVKIDHAEDALYLRLDDAKVIESEQVAPGVIVDFDRRDKVVGIEVLDVSKRARDPGTRKQAAPSLTSSIVREKPARKYRA
ncbi:MAG: DUF2283 domain-containing protein [Verrucomicrobia bacterium]|nr:DUF2283 domain-containing protein [Verrucomicrobiota bacterium]MBU1908821.1 DUF2283 domain-containing protein [Verrucomicrobiota bacterium]